MRLFLVFGTCAALIFSAVAAYADDCVDLSHSTSLGGLPLTIKQLGCEKWVYQQLLDGKPIGDATEKNFSADWDVFNIDDEYEKTENRQHWFWNKDRTVLVHEYSVQSLDKKGGETSFSSGVETYRVGDQDTILREGQRIVRIEKSSGEVEIKSARVKEVLVRLK